MLAIADLALNASGERDMACWCECKASTPETQQMCRRTHRRLSEVKWEISMLDHMFDLPPESEGGEG